MRRIRLLAFTTALAACLASAASAQDAPRRRVSIRTPIVEAVEAAGPAVVNISTEKLVTMTIPGPRRLLFDEDQFDQFFERHETMNLRARSLGSGVLFDSRGYIVTNEHVVRRASKIQVTLKDKRSYTGKLISADPVRDLAVIKIDDPKPFPVANVYRREPLMIGETAIAVGNPFGFEHTVTVGVISATNRNVTVKGQVVMAGLIQTDASINPGNSGGALLDVNGDLIGLNTAIRSGAEGIGFAIPVDAMRAALVDLLDFRRLDREWVGAALVGLLNSQTNQPVGLRVMQVLEDSPAAKAGIEASDIITRLNGRPCVDVLAFEIDILEAKAGDRLTFDLLRKGEEMTRTVTLERIPQQAVSDVVEKRLGLTAEAPTAEDRQRLNFDAEGGLIVRKVEAGGPAAAAGLMKDDIIALFNNFRVTDVDELATGLARIRAGDAAVVVIVRKGFKNYTYIRVR